LGGENASVIWVNICSVIGPVLVVAGVLLVLRTSENSPLSEASYKRAMVQYSKNGWQSGEPGELEDSEQPILVSNALEVLRTRRGLGSDALARNLRIETEDLEKLASAPLEMKLTVPL
jgi:hypothetical protein